MAAIEVDEVCRSFRSRPGTVQARHDRGRGAASGVSFSVEPGELFGLLGPNGAGKTTTIKILTTLLLPTSGSARVLGLRPGIRAREGAPRIGYVFGGDRGLYDRLSALDNLSYFADVYRVPIREKRRGSTSCSSSSGCRAASASASRRTRAECGSGCTSRAACCTTRRCSSSTSRRSGSTRSARASCARRSPALRDAGKTILLTTHYMFEADELCGRVAVITGGRIVADGTPAALKAGVADRTVIEIEAFGVDEPALDRLARARRRDLGLVEAARPGAGDPRAVELGAAADPARCSALLDGMTVGERDGARADARGRVRRAGGQS